LPDANRFTGARSNFTRFARSGGNDRRSMGRAVSGYVSKASGGSGQAAQRMGASRAAGGRLLEFLSNVQTIGVTEALRVLNLDSLAGRPIEEIFLGLMDFVCPEAVTIDDGIAREAYIETIIELTTLGTTDFNSFNADQLQTVFEMYVTHAIEARICNDIGTKAIVMPADATSALKAQVQLRDFIRGAVNDAVTRERAISPILATTKIQGFVDSVYKSAFSILQTLGEAEAKS